MHGYIIRLKPMSDNPGELSHMSEIPQNTQKRGYTTDRAAVDHTGRPLSDTRLAVDRYGFAVDRQSVAVNRSPKTSPAVDHSGRPPSGQKPNSRFLSARNLKQDLIFYDNKSFNDSKIILKINN